MAKGYSQTEAVKKKRSFGISTAASYTNDGLACIFLLDWSYKSNSFYAGPKLMAKRTYNPKEGIYGWDVGYRRKYISGRFISCFFNLDLQGRVCRVYDQRVQYRWDDIIYPKINCVAEAFAGNTILIKVYKNFMLGNTLGVGGCIDSHYTYDRIRKTSIGVNRQVMFFLRYKL